MTIYAPMAAFSAVKGIFESVLRWKSVKGGTGNLPVSVGDPPNGIPSPPRTGRGQGEVSKRVASSNGPFRQKTRVCEIENHGQSTMRRIVFDQMQSGMNWN